MSNPFPVGCGTTRSNRNTASIEDSDVKPEDFTAPFADQPLAVTIVNEEIFYSGEVTCLSWAPGTRRKLLASGHADGRVVVRDLTDPVESRVLWAFDAHKGVVNSLAWSRDRARLATGGDDDSVWIWDCNSPQKKIRVATRTGVLALAWLSDGQQLAVAESVGNAFTYEPVGDIATNLWTPPHDSAVRAIWGPGGGSLARLTSDGVLHILQATGSTATFPANGQDQVRAFCWSPDGGELAVVTTSHTCLLWNYRTGGTRRLMQASQTMSAVAWSPTGAISLGLAVGDVCVWDVQTKEQRYVLTTAGDGPIDELSWSPSGGSLAAVSVGSPIYYWDVTSPQEVQKLQGQARKMSAIAWSPAGLEVAEIAANEGKVWSFRGAFSCSSLDTLSAPTHLAWAPDGQHLAVATDAGDVEIHSVLGGSQRGVWSRVSIVPLQQWTSDMVWAPDSARLAVGGIDGGVVVWDLNSPTELALLATPADDGPVNSIWWAPDGRRLAVGFESGVARVYQADGACVDSLKTDTEDLQVLWLHDEDWLAIGTDAGQVTAWETNKHPQRLGSQFGAIGSIAVTPDAGRIATTDLRGAIWIWDRHSGQRNRVLRGDASGVKAIAWSSDGAYLAAIRGNYLIVLGPDYGVVHNEVVVDAISLSWDPNTHCFVVSGHRAGALYRVDETNGERWEFNRIPAVCDQYQSLGEAIKGPTDDGLVTGDSPIGVEDRLQRRPLAREVAVLLNRFAQELPGASITLGLHGTWGAGKSTLVSFLESELQQNSRTPSWTCVSYNAWQESPTKPIWWAIANTLGSESCYVRMRSRLRLMSLTYLRRNFLLMAVLFLLIFANNVWHWNLTQLSVLSGAVAFLGSLLLVVNAANTAMTLLSGGVRREKNWLAGIYEQSAERPMPQIKKHFQKLRKWNERNVLLVIDDLDRCSASTVVEVVETVQTLVRDDGTWSSKRKKLPTLVVMLVGDQRWVERAFNTYYSEFEGAVDSGRELGQLFYEKVVQATIHLFVPEPRFFDSLVESQIGQSAQYRPRSEVVSGRVTPAFQEKQPTRVNQQPSQGGRSADGLQERLEPRSNALPQSPLQSGALRMWPAETLDPKFVEALNTGDTMLLEQLASDLSQTPELRDLAYRRLVHAERRRQSGNDPHALDEFEAHLIWDLRTILEENPRWIKRFLFNYELCRAANRASGNIVPTDRLARWTVLWMRFPSIVWWLQADPTRVERIVSWAAANKSEGDEPLALVQNYEAIKRIVADGEHALEPEHLMALRFA